MYLLIVLLPLIGAILSGFGGRFLGKKGAGIVATSLLGITALFSWLAFYEVGLCQSPVYLKIMPWIESGMLDVQWGFIFDSLTVVMLIVVTSVSFLVHMYSLSYMEHDPHLPRFMAYLSFFTYFMLMLVTADNFVQMFLGWEGVGLCSYLLINFWFTRLQANKSAIKAMIMNRIGDFGLSLGIMGIYYVFQSLDFAAVFATAYTVQNHSFIFCNQEVDILTCICILLFIGSIGKSAQLGLHTWLPDAMEGPTPVSALIHAATMVTAGVFLIVRCSPMFEYAPTALLVVALIGAMTAFFAATTGLVQNDLKRVIAYSTCSQLGYMVFSCGISCYSVSMFHLMNHAFFKALLFLSAGSIIHAMADEQDMRKMGGIVQLLPFTYAMMLIGSLSLMGFPFLTGFYSKDVILELSFARYSIDGTFAHWLGTISAGFTAYYSFRLLYLTFLGKTNAYRSTIEHAHDAPIIMAIPLMLLAVGSIFVGYLFKDMIIGIGTSFWGNAIYLQPTNNIAIDAEFIPIYVKMLPVILSIISAYLAFVFNESYSELLYKIKQSTIGYELFNFFNKRWYFDRVYNEYSAKYLLSAGYHITYKTLDKGLIEIVGPYGIINVTNKLSKVVSKIQNGYIDHYAFIIILGITGLIFITQLVDNLAVDGSMSKAIIIGLICLVAFIFDRVVSTNTNE